MDFLRSVMDWFLHLDVHLNVHAADFGPWMYLILFAVIFCETGLVVTPFLPGDSLLFAIGALIGRGLPLNIGWLALLLWVAAVLGDAANYAIGHYLGPKVFKYENSRFLNRKHLLRTQAFYEKYGAKTVILARFVPIVRTFAPFVAGIGAMRYPKFAFYNVIGAAAWVPAFLLAGYFFCELPIVKDGFHYVIAAIILISVTPMAWEWYKARQKAAPVPFAAAPTNSLPLPDAPS
jgi:membrane-associated protein